VSRVLVAMSGGVDSSVAAALMRDEGHEVIGVTLKLWSGPNGEAPTAGCCTVSDAEDARRVAAQLDIPYYVLDYTEDFSQGVIDSFVVDYKNGRTPNPCVECNRTVKFSRLLSQASEFGCDMVVTGHYARTRFEDGRWKLLRAVDGVKDQSYVLSMLGQEQLGTIRFPLGDIDKAETRRIAAHLGLRTAHKAESMDICFVGRRDYRSFLTDIDPTLAEPGRFADLDGGDLGPHPGIVNYTVGQRRGLGIALGEPRYVIEVDAASRTVLLGRHSDLAVSAISLDRLTFVGPPATGAVEVQYRAHGEPVPGRIEGNTIRFEQVQFGVAPGQTAALYDGDEVLGGGIIESTVRR
jgi:tRNA-specific 2-thiouridylase